MPRPYGGHSPLGTELNKVGSAQDGTNVSRIKYITGRIKSFATIKDGSRVEATDPKSDGLYEFKVKLEDGKITNFLPFVAAVDDIDRHPSSFLNNSCFIMFEGQSSNRGKILSIIDDKMDPVTVGAANQLQISGAAFAPPGSGLI